jgi:UDP-galactopyranose mutase
MTPDILIVGSGLYGLVLAERLANVKKKKVLILEKRSHIGGNCYSEICPQTNIEYHKYGTHIFHTSSKKVWDYITEFTEFNQYHHQVKANIAGEIFQLPINLSTINQFFSTQLTPSEALEFLTKEIKKTTVLNDKTAKNFEELAISSIGKELYQAFVKGYTTKQWGVSPEKLPASIFKRLPVRFNYNNTYFQNARWQGLPLRGMNEIFKNLTKNPLIDIKYDTDYFQVKHQYKFKERLIYTGPIDQFYEYKFNKLTWRSVKFDSEVVETTDFQGNSVVNFPSLNVDFTRIHEPQHLYPERKHLLDRSLIIKEYPDAVSERPYYPVRSSEDLEKYNQYVALSQKDDKVHIGGRLGNYAYWDMDKTIENALLAFETF